jgi:glycosyltransferase involved in cell wall biosynthesis
MRSTSLRVLSIAHNAVAASNRARYAALGGTSGVEVRLLTPKWWFEEGRRIEASQHTSWRTGSTLFTGNGTRHVYVTGLIESLRQTRPDVIDLFEEPFSLVALQTLWVRDLLAPDAALIFYSAVNVDRRWRLPYRAIERLVLRRADGAHTPNRDAAGILRAKGMPNNRPVRVIPLGVDPEPFEAAQPVDLAGIAAPRIGFVGRLEPVKGLDVLLDAFDRLRTRASLVIAGAGSERRRLAARARGRVHIVPPVQFEALPGFLKTLDVLVLPSVTILPMHREQFGRVLVEAMAAGVPVIGSSSGAIPDVIGDAGLVVPERDADALATAIDAVLGNADLRQQCVARGRLRVKTRFAWGEVAEQMLELFDAALTCRRGKTANLEVVGA